MCTEHTRLAQLLFCLKALKVPPRYLKCIKTDCVVLQGPIKKRKADHEKCVDKEWLELDNAKMEAFDEKVKQKLIDEYERKMSNAKVIHEQLHEFKMKYIKRM
jgi:hypothetical protein